MKCLFLLNGVVRNQKSHQEVDLEVISVEEDKAGLTFSPMSLGHLSAGPCCRSVLPFPAWLLHPLSHLLAAWKWDRPSQVPSRSEWCSGVCIKCDRCSWAIAFMRGTVARVNEQCLPQIFVELGKNLRSSQRFSTHHSTCWFAVDIALLWEACGRYGVFFNIGAGRDALCFTNQLDKELGDYKAPVSALGIGPLSHLAVSTCSRGTAPCRKGIKWKASASQRLMATKWRSQHDLWRFGP